MTLRNQRQHGEQAGHGRNMGETRSGRSGDGRNRAAVDTSDGSQDRRRTGATRHGPAGPRATQSGLTIRRPARQGKRSARRLRPGVADREGYGGAGAGALSEHTP